MRDIDVSLPAAVGVNDDVTRCRVLVNVQQEADVHLPAKVIQVSLIATTHFPSSAKVN